MSSAAIITLAQDIGARIARLWWPLRAGRVGQVGQLLFELAYKLHWAEADKLAALRSEEDARRELVESIVLQRETAQAHAESLHRRDELQALVEKQELTIARLAGELHAERERCARLILRLRRSKA